MKLTIQLKLTTCSQSRISLAPTFFLSLSFTLSLCLSLINTLCMAGHGRRRELVGLDLHTTALSLHQITRQRLNKKSRKTGPTRAALLPVRYRTIMQPCKPGRRERCRFIPGGEEINTSIYWTTTTTTRSQSTSALRNVSATLRK